MCQAHRQVSFGFSEQKFPAGTHICYLYNDEKEHQFITAKFIESGLCAGEKVGYLVDRPAPEALDGCLSWLGFETAAGLESGQLLFSRAENAYCPEGAFSPERMVAYWRTLYQQALDERFTGMRATGEARWIHDGMPGVERWIEYEAMINQLVEECPISGIMCQYDVSRIDGATLYDVLSVHPMMIVAGQIVHNPYYQSPREFLAKRRQAG